ncbi:MAG: hypothetical protein L0I29_01450 [Hyphomicrobiales bacterium]|nr:hypothetical protein [Hyphomicrobiales bacterium]
MSFFVRRWGVTCPEYSASFGSASMFEGQINSWADGDEGGNEKKHSRHRYLSTDPAQTPSAADLPYRFSMSVILAHFFAFPF